MSSNNQNTRGNLMYNNNQKIIKNKVGLLNLAEELGNVSKACKVMGLSGLSLQLCKFLHKSLNIFMNSIFKFNQKMSHSFSPILNWHSPFCSDIINCQV